MTCRSCHQRHYKCDGRQPQCGRCMRAGRRCIRDREMRFRVLSQARSGTDAFPSDQIWVPVPPNVDFLDVTSEIQAGEWPLSLVEGPLRSESTEVNLSRQSDLSSAQISELVSPRETLTTVGGHDHESPEFAAHGGWSSPLPGGFQRDSTPSLASPSGHEHLQGNCTPLPCGPSSIYSDSLGWPLQDSQDAFLLQHFISVVSLFFDFCDQERHFATEVPQRARACWTLLHAMLALSARHLSRTTQFSLFVADQHYHQCLQTLVPALDDGATIVDETLFAIVVILRLLEEFDASILGFDAQKHLLGAKSLTYAQEKIGMGSGLRQAAYWACLRQEIYVSLRYQHLIRFNLQPYQESEAVKPTNKCFWANRATLHCAAAIQFAFGEERRANYKELMDFNDKWVMRAPGLVQPFYHAESKDGGFPDIKYAADHHVIGAQYMALARILLVTHNPAIPRVGPAHRHAMQLVEEDVKRNVLRTCGVAVSNSTTPAALLMACMGILLGGSSFTAKIDQERLDGILGLTEKLHGWPTSTIQEQLRQTWGWDDAPKGTSLHTKV